MALMVKLPAADIADEEEEAASRPRETSRHEWDRLAAQASLSAPASADAVPPPEMLEETSFEDMPVEEEVPGVEAEAVELPRYPRSTASRPAEAPRAQGPMPGPQATSRPRVMQAPAAPAPAPRSYGPEGAPRRPQAARPAPYQPSVRSTQPQTPAPRSPSAATRPPAPEDRPILPKSSSPRRPSVASGPDPRTPKNAETLEDILAILENK